MTTSIATNKPGVALVTGGTRGIGRQTALTLAGAGYDVAFCYRSDTSAAKDLESELADLGVHAMGLRADVADEDQVIALFSEVEQRFSQLDVLVNNAGVTRDNLLMSMTSEEIMGVLQTNIVGTMLCSREALKLMVPRKRGSIVNISSVSATRPNRGQTNYAASKGAVESFTRALAVEVARKKIRVNAVAPGIIETEMSAQLMSGQGDELSKHILLGRPGGTDDIARAVLYFADPSNSYVTGQSLHVNGGLTLS